MGSSFVALTLKLMRENIHSRHCEEPTGGEAIQSLFAAFWIVSSLRQGESWRYQLSLSSQ